MSVELLTNHILLGIHDDIIDIANVRGCQGREHAWGEAVGSDAVRSLANRFLRTRRLHVEIRVVLLSAALFASVE